MSTYLEKTIINLVKNFNTETLQEFFYLKANDKWEENLDYLPQFENDFFTEILKAGNLKLEDNYYVGVYTIQVEKELTERSSKKRQFDLGKRILEDNSVDAGFFVFYDTNNNFRFSFIYSTYHVTKRKYSPYKRYTYYVNPELTNKTFRFALRDADFSSLATIIEAFSIEKVTEEFFEAYKYVLKEVIIKSLSQYDISYVKKHSFAQQLLSRILFVYFLQRKGWFKWQNYVQDKTYIKNLWSKYKDWKTKTNAGDVFYSQWLSSLFFGAFNKKIHFIHKDLPEDIRESFSLMPFLNGGLFSHSELDELGFEIPDYVFEWFFEPDDKDKRKGFLEIFNFTIDESSPIDVEVAVDPEMLGKVYESLIAEEERGGSGIFYTPRVEIDFMCRLSLVNYLTQTEIDKEKLINFIFDPHNETLINNLTSDELRKIKSALDKVKIVDPSVGSASFLVGMLNILVDLNNELKKRLDGKEENLFALKNKIISESLYGVDVKDWAVMVGELRLWLNLIVETDEKYMDIYTKPLLPNLSFKLRQGDSLIEEIADIPLKLHSNFVIPNNVKQKITELADKKAAYFSSQRSADLKEKEEIEKLELEILKEIINSKIKELLQKKTDLEKDIKKSQKNFYGKQTKEQTKKNHEKKNKLSTVLKEIEDLQKVLSQAASKKAKKNYFLWEIAFAEVFSQKSGFDIVIGNPPYVRQELIAPPLENYDNYTNEVWRKIKKQYKDKLILAVKNMWGNNIKIDKKSDLYVYFYYQGLSLLRSGGIFCFINSNSWLDVGYGTGLQEFLLKDMEPLFVIDNTKKRSFKQADVNTVIVLIRRPFKRLDDFTIKFIAFKKPFEDVLNAEVIQRIEKADKPIFEDEDFKLYPKTKKDLLLEGAEISRKNTLFEIDPHHLPYIGNKWGGKYLRAPEIYFKILEKGKGKLVRLGDIAEVKFGIKTGANEFFYLKPIGMTVKNVVNIAESDPRALIRVKNSAGWEGEIEAKFLKPLLFSLKEVEKYRVELDLLERLILFCPKSRNEGKIIEYINWGEIQKFDKRPSVRGRKSWYIILSKFYPHFVSNRFLGKRFGFPVVENILVCDVFFIGTFKNIDKNIGVALINSTISYLSIEVIARKTYGIGVAYIYGPEINNLLLLNPNLLSKKLVSDLKNVFEKIKLRPIYSIFTELGFNQNKPIREQKPNPLPDRKALDDIVFDALGLTEEERKEVYWAVAELVKNRLEKAKSV